MTFKAPKPNCSGKVIKFKRMSATHVNIRDCCGTPVSSIKIPIESVIFFYKRVVIPGKLHSAQDS